MLPLFTDLASRFRRDDKGATAVEYGIMVALIAVAIIVAVTLLGSNLTKLFGQIGCDVNGGGTYTASSTGGSPSCVK